MSVELFVEPSRSPLTWEGFTFEAPRFSVALDGYVGEGPAYDPTGPFANFNHHEGVDRLATRATCGQVLVAVRQGLFDSFRDEYGPKANVFVNDCDEDVCMSWYLLRQGYVAEQIFNPILNKLVHIEDMLDATAGAYPFPRDMPALRELAWIFQPYRNFRKSGEIDKRDPQAFKTVIEDVCRRIDQALVGHPGEVGLNTNYCKCGGGPNWVLVDESRSGEYLKTGMFADGVRAYVSYRERPDGNFVYTIGRMSQFIPFDVAHFLKVLDEIEGNPDDHWGGGNTIGGSPRVAGSRLTPDEVTAIINGDLTAKLSA